MRSKITKYKSILITGGAGFIGTHLCAELTRRGLQVVVLDLKAPQNAVDGVRYVRGDVRDKKILTPLIDEADAAYHLAATVSVPLCQENPVDSYSNNVLATISVLDAIVENSKRTGRKPIPFVFASTAALYGFLGDDGRALKETDLPENFLSYYAAQKHASEQAISLYHRFHGLSATVFRFFNVFGPYQDPSSPYSGVITLFIHKAKNNEALPLNGGGTQTRDFISVYDIAFSCAQALESAENNWNAQAINLGSGQAHTIKELALKIKSACESRSEIISAPPREGDVAHSLADITRARMTVGLKPRLNIEELLKEI